MKNKWLTFVDSANPLDVGNVPTQVGDAGFSGVALNRTSACLGLAAPCTYRVGRLPQSRDTNLVLRHLLANTLLVATEHGDVLDDCDCDYRLHISFGHLGKYMSYVDDRGFADEVEHYLLLEPE